MAKWPRYGNCKTRLSKDIGKSNALKVQNKMLNHTFSVSKYLIREDISEICLAINGIGFKRGQQWCKQLGIANFSLQGKGCLGEKMKRQILKIQRCQKNNDLRNLIFIGTDLPNLCHLDIIETISRLENNDVVLGPSNDGGYWLIAFSKTFIYKHNFLPFIDINWSSEEVLKKTVENLNQKRLKVDYLNMKIDIDTVKDIYQIK
tara:strand:- start:2748 stop:3359 length:612 start_codon:yes stop_codon:yes gene_type:complete